MVCVFALHFAALTVIAATSNLLRFAVFQYKKVMYFFMPHDLKVFFLALAMAAFSTASSLAQAQPAPIKVALIESLSGPFANTGEAVFRDRKSVV